MCVLFYCIFECLHVCAYAFKFMVHCGSAFEPGASRLPYYCTPPLCVPAIIGALAVWRGGKKKLTWIWTDFSSEQCRATASVETAGGAARAGGKGQPAQCSRKTQDKFAIGSIAQRFLHRCIGAHTRMHVYFLRGVWYVFRQVF